MPFPLPFDNNINIEYNFIVKQTKRWWGDIGLRNAKECVFFNHKNALTLETWSNLMKVCHRLGTVKWQAGGKKRQSQCLLEYSNSGDISHFLGQRVRRWRPLLSAASCCPITPLLPRKYGRPWITAAGTSSGPPPPPSRSLPCKGKRRVSCPSEGQPCPCVSSDGAARCAKCLAGFQIWATLATWTPFCSRSSASRPSPMTCWGRASLGRGFPSMRCSGSQTLYLVRSLRNKKKKLILQNQGAMLQKILLYLIDLSSYQIREWKCIFMIKRF